MRLPAAERLLSEISSGSLLKVPPNLGVLREGCIYARRSLFSHSSREISPELQSFVDDLTTELLMTLLGIPNSQRPIV